MQNTTLTRDSYTIGIICALDVELAAVEAMLDNEHARIPPAPGDTNDYTFGSIGQHDVVIGCLPGGGAGTVSAATLAKDMMRSFPIRVGLMVGIAGGVWSHRKDVRLGDVIVSEPGGVHGGVVQWDMGKEEAGGIFRRTGSLNKPPHELLSTVQGLKAKHRKRSHQLLSHLDYMLRKFPDMADNGYQHQGPDNDELFAADYNHQVEGDQTCQKCDRARLVLRPSRVSQEPALHYGIVASGNRVIKDAVTRDLIANQEGVICFEMEAAGLMDTFPCLVIRGICDYADSHKNKRWQPYASATAAAYVRELLLYMQASVVKDMVLASTTAAFTKYSIPFKLPSVAIDYFTAREADMKRLSDFFFATNLASTRRRVFAVCGMGGIGKTQLAVEFARTYARTKFSAVFWWDGSSRDALNRSVAEAATQLPTREDVTQMDDSQRRTYVLQWLTQPDNSHWLIVMDNVDLDWQSEDRDVQAYDYVTFLPSTDHGNVLLTSRLDRLQQRGGGFVLGGVDDYTARGMIEGQAGQPIKDVESLLPELGGLPLALVQAGAYLRATHMTVADYRAHYQATWAELMQKQGQYPLPEYNKSILTTWQMSYKRIKHEDQQAARLLDLWAFLHRDDIWLELILGGPRHNDEQPDCRSFRALFPDLTKLSLQHSIGVLVQYSMVNAISATARHSIHPLVHSWCFHNIKTQERQLEYLGVALALVALAACKDLFGLMNNESSWRLAPHAQVLSAKIWSHSDDNRHKADELRVSNCVVVADFLKARNMFTEAERLSRWALRKSERSEGIMGIFALGAVSQIGSLYDSQGRGTEAEEWYVRAARGYENAHADHPAQLANLANLSGLYARQGEFVKAAGVLQRQCEVMQSSGCDVFSTATLLNTIARLHRDEGDLTTALQVSQYALDFSEETFGPDNVQTLYAVYDLGIVYIRQNNLAMAEVMMIRAMEGYDRARGAEDFMTLQSAYRLGSIYMSQDKFMEAEKMLLRAYTGIYKSQGAEDGTTLDAAFHLGNAYALLHKPAEAVEMLSRAMRGYERVYGAEHPDTLAAAYRLGCTYGIQGRMMEAETTLSRVLRGLEKLPETPTGRLELLKKRLSMITAVLEKVGRNKTPLEYQCTMMSLLSFQSRGM